MDVLQPDLAALQALELAELRVRWRRLARKPAPAHLGRALLIRMIAYRLQAQAQGDLDRDSLRYLDQVHRAEQQRHEGDRGTRRAGGVPRVPAVPDPRKGSLKVGTLLVREHRGRAHRVMVLDQGFAYEGATYASLSEIARAITGTSWNGPRFFGLRERCSGSRLGQEPGGGGA